MNRNVSTLLCAIVLFLIAGCGSGDTAETTAEKTIDFKQLVERDGIWYEVNSEVGFTGRSVGTYENGQKKVEGTFKDGKENGKRAAWFENGQKEGEATWKDGKQDGKRTEWYENGQKQEEATFKDGKPDGKRTFWYESGQKQEENTFKDGKEDGKATVWYPNGQKAYENTYKDGKKIESTTWDENGREIPH